MQQLTDEQTNDLLTYTNMMIMAGLKVKEILANQERPLSKRKQLIQKIHDEVNRDLLKRSSKK